MHDQPTILPVLPSEREWRLHDVAASRRIEQAGIAASGPHVLMQRAGLAVARLARAIAPHARSMWIACGPGNNGGDGMVAARWLHRQGCTVQVSLAAPPDSLPDDARLAWQQARDAGVPIAFAAGQAPHDCELCIDALLGVGASRPPEGAIAQAIAELNRCGAPVLAVDLPSGLAADNGRWLGRDAVRATHTLSLLTLKPGLFTAEGRDVCGRVWLAGLDVGTDAVAPSARLIGPPRPRSRAHASHKGSFGDLIVVGGAAGMTGAALLASRAALLAGAGRVLLVRLDGSVEPDLMRAEVMPRRSDEMLQPAMLRSAAVVCGCGGGDAVRPLLPVVLHHAARLVLDADALNVIAADSGLRKVMRSRRSRGLDTIATPHPLEAARLLGLTSPGVQSDRIGHATRLADDLQCTVVLKGSGTVVASPGEVPAINPTGNARLAGAGSGDVLAGWLGGLLAQYAKDAASELACRAVWVHGRAAELGPASGPLPAADLIGAMARVSSPR